MVDNYPAVIGITIQDQGLLQLLNYRIAHMYIHCDRC